MAVKVTEELHALMWQAYCERQTALHVATTCDVAQGTAKHYIKDGDAKRGWLPFELRMKGTVVRAEERADYTLAKAHAESIKAVKHVQAVALRQLEALEMDKNGKFKNPIQAIEVAHKLAQDIMGEGQKLSVRHHGLGGEAEANPFEGLPDDDVLHFMRAGLAALERYGWGQDPAVAEAANRVEDAASVLQ